MGWIAVLIIGSVVIWFLIEAKNNIDK